MKRRGFTLIELMVVIAIIIILAAIAIPNYLNMTKRAKNSRLSADMATLATALETYKTDWGQYPVFTTAHGQAVSDTANLVNKALTGPESVDALGGDLNVAANINAIGEHGPINYIKGGTMASITNPFGLPTATPYVMYFSTAAGATQTWTLYAQTDAAAWTVRTSNSSTPTVVAAQP
ncbi:MAG: type II secretion system protein [Candidatus Cryosericum sp.]